MHGHGGGAIRNIGGLGICGHASAAQIGVTSGSFHSLNLLRHCCVLGMNVVVSAQAKLCVCDNKMDECIGCF